MQPRKHRVGFAFFPYGGNGGTSSEVPDIRNWLLRTVIKAKNDERVEEVLHKDFSDTPITMTRNLAVKWARDSGVDVLVMVDSDMSPDLYDGDPGAKEFFESSFDFLCRHYERGPVVVGAPYCGPPAHPVHGGGENVYIFRWANRDTGSPNSDMRLEQFSREESEYLGGIRECAALPTGLIMFDVRAFDLISHPYFYYEYTDETQSAKASTEDVTATRDISLNGALELGYNPIFCNWDAWAGHWKPKCVGKPETIAASQVSEKLKAAALRGNTKGEKVRKISPSPRLLAMRELGELAESSATQEENPYESGKRMIRVGENDFGHKTPEWELDFLRCLVAHEASANKLLTRLFTIVELGSWTGGSAVVMAEGVEPGQCTMITCVDHWGGTGTDLMREAALKYGKPAVFEKFKSNVDACSQKFPHVRFDYIESDSVKGASLWQCGQTIDFLFIDAGHTYHEVVMDIEAWFDHVRPGAMLCGHDCGPLFPGVEEAVQECFGDLWQKQKDGTIWFTHKTAEVIAEYMERKAARDKRRSPTNGELVHA